MANGQGLKLIEPLRSLYKVCPSLSSPFHVSMSRLTIE